MEFRRAWLETVVGKYQAFTGNVIAADNTDELVAAALSWMDSLPDASSRAEDLALRGILFDVAIRCAALIHDRAHPHDTTRQCEFVTTFGLEAFAAARERSAKELFKHWARLFSREFVRVHPPSPAQRVAALIQERETHRCDIPRLARLVGVAPARLRTGFLRECGLPLPEYVRRVRLLRALEILTGQGGKIEALALRVGYRSKKNFYRAFRQLTGLTPAQFRRLSPDAASQIVESTRRSLVHLARSADASTKELRT